MGQLAPKYVTDKDVSAPGEALIVAEPGAASLRQESDGGYLRRASGSQRASIFLCSKRQPRKSVGQRRTSGGKPKVAKIGF
jgi:hypothetical protein